MEMMVAVGAVIEDDEGRILLVKHVDEKGGFWKGKWICPGGKLQLGERIEEGIEREVLEETNLQIKLVAPLVPFDRVVKEGEETKLHVVYIDYLAKLVGGELKPASDVGQAIWVPKEQVPAIWAELHDDTKRLLEIAGMVSVGGN
ncbi:MAG: NUDIX domain-containing protein [Chloroflexi bacterium]|nr:NUDIX domain-containing protein [Chloroflexota bacterium]